MEIYDSQIEKFKPGDGAQLIYHRDYGEIRSYLATDLETSKARIEDGVIIEVPKELIEFCQLIKDVGGLALLVGGKVRDEMINKIRGTNIKSKDFDFEIYGITSEDLEKIISVKYGYSNLDSAGKSFEVFKIGIPGTGITIDASITRRDSKVDADNRRSSIQADGDPRMTIIEAAKRRDVRMNTMAYDPLTKETYDFYEGKIDILNGQINFTDAEAFKEDPLRVLRVMQFISRFGFIPTPQTYVLCLELVEEGECDKLSRERICEEFVKLLTRGINPSAGLKFAREIGFIQKYMPELYSLINTPQELAWHPDGDVWEHTLQVVDAAADIARREGLNSDDTLTLLLSALTHDFGKVEKTEIKDGKIRSLGHEEAGVIPARSFLERLFANPKARLTSDITKRVLPLVAEHLKPKYFWENETKRGIKQKKALNNLAERLQNGDQDNYSDGGNTNIYLLALLAEADQRGRNPKGVPWAKEDVPELQLWQEWILKKSEEQNVTKSAPEKILKKGQILLDNIPGTKGGVWIGVVLRCVYLDQLDQKISNLEEAITIAKRYHEIFNKRVDSEDRDVWKKLSQMQDPRSYLAT